MYVTDAVDFYLGKVAPNRLKPRTLKVTHSTLRTWRRELGPRTKLENVTTGKILMVRDNYKEPATANRMTSVLSSLMDAAVEREWITDNPCRRIKPLRVDNADTGKHISEEDEAILKAAAHKLDPQLYTLLCLSFESGARLSELEELTPNVVDLEARQMTFLTTKNGSVRHVPLSKEMAEHIREHGLPGKMSRWRWNKVVAELAYPVRFHDIRHTMISRALSRGVPIAVVGKMVGHKTLAMTVRYQHVDVDELRFIVE